MLAPLWYKYSHTLGIRKLSTEHLFSIFHHPKHFKLRRKKGDKALKMFRNTNYFAPWWILVLKQMGLESVPFYLAWEDRPNFRSTSPRNHKCLVAVGTRGFKSNKRTCNAFTWMRADPSIYTHTHTLMRQLLSLLSLNAHSSLYLNNTSACQVNWKTRDVRGAWFDPRMEVSCYEPPVHRTVNRSKHICFCVQQPHIYNCKLAVMA